MTEQQFLDLCKSRYPAILKLKELNDFYEYEKQYAEIMQDLNRAVFEGSISKLPADRRKKKRFVPTEK
jgi:hypothetical protein